MICWILITCNHELVITSILFGKINPGHLSTNPQEFFRNCFVTHRFTKVFLSLPRLIVFASDESANMLCMLELEHAASGIAGAPGRAQRGQWRGSQTDNLHLSF